MISNKIIQKEFFMELVYLWVEDYKNIERQGFNFSPRFRCEYDENTKELKVVDKEKTGEFYPKNFFGDNINVTAIVGENGTGKSSLIKLILMLIFYKKYNSISYYENEINILKQELENKALFLIINTVDGYKKICLNIDINNASIIELDNANIDFYSIYFSYMLDTLQNKKDYWMWNLYHKSDNYETPILFTPNKFHKDFLQNSINLDDIEYVNINHSIKFYKKNIETKINDFFNPNRIKLYSDNPSHIQEVEFDFFGKVAGKFLNLIKKKNVNIYYEDIDSKKTKREKTEEYYENINKQLNVVKDLEKQRQYKKINLLYIALKIMSSSKSSFLIEVYDSIEKWFKERLYEDNFIEEGIKLIESNIDKIFIDATVKYNNEKINDCIEFYKNTSDSNEEILNKLLDREILKLSDFEDISIILIPWLNLELLEDNKSFNSLSGGQKLFFTFMVNMMDEVSNLIQVEEYKTINLFLDEVESSYHPNWQKKFIKNISNALGNIDLKGKKINIFFSTHSPFILSDLPKENVIFLEKDEKTGNCINVTNKVDINPFGANIHTLLSHGFFMKDGLMGEFAKNKISKILNFLNGKNKFIDIPINQIKPILEIIGEDFLREKLLKMYDEKFKIKSKDDEIKELKAEIERLKNAQNKI
jgi:energy-coupling factor transporter ATP-binding protein EcfA2